jgi:hypothetical protein
MKAFYFMIHWDGPYVTGFISFGETPKHAMTALKRALWVRLKLEKEQRQAELSTNNVKLYLRSLKRPWRKTKKGYPVVRVTELGLPILAGYWLQDIIRDQNYCNLTDTNNPAEVYGKKAGGKEL